MLIFTCQLENNISYFVLDFQMLQTYTELCEKLGVTVRSGSVNGLWNEELFNTRRKLFTVPKVEWLDNDITYKLRSYYGNMFRPQTVIFRPIENIFKVKQNEHSMGSHFVNEMYLKNVLCWPDDDRLIAETCCHNVIWVYIEINVTILIYSCV